MFARSPRGSISAASNVAEDFEDSLKDLQQNNRYEISNLTLIAKESTESAQAISKALENHIRTTAPPRKLPALYVLDSIVKNVGTPYTVYLGRNLFNIFMDAYLLVDNNTRRSMEGMLKTWKEPVPGSLDPRPVFPPEAVQPIDSALLRAKAAVQQNQPAQHLATMAYQNTMTPPPFQTPFPYPMGQVQQPYNGYASQNATPQNQPYPTPGFSQQFQPPNIHSTISSSNAVDVIKNDLAGLITHMQTQFANNPQDLGLRTKLQALLQLSEVLSIQAHALKPSELDQIRAQISQLSSTSQRVATPTQVPQWQAPPYQAPSTYPSAPQNANVYPQQPVSNYGQQHTIPSVLAPGALDGLQALLAGTQKPSTPQIRSAAPALQNASHSQLSRIKAEVNNAGTSMNSTDLLAALAKNNLLPMPASLPSVSAAVPAQAPPTNTTSTESLLASIKAFLPVPPNTGASTTSISGRPSVPMNAAALKVFRPELIRSLYEARPNQCTNCGRRFSADADGRAKKQRHLDWHFRTNQRMADSSMNRGHHRSWFVDEMEWIRLAEFDPSTTTAEDAVQLHAKKKEKDVQESFIRAPPGMTKNTCSICYEEMKSSYSEDLQDWIFTDAIQFAQGKIVHATCASEMKRTAQTSQISAPSAGAMNSLAATLTSLGGGKTSRSATPDSTLGKRKAEMVLAGTGAQRVKME